jgi:serine/threonine-protein kinase
MSNTTSPNLAALDAARKEPRRKGDSSEHRTANVLGHFRLLRKLGEGGMGSVFQAEDVGDKAIVAVKILRKAVAARPTAVPRFLREARMMAQIDHPNVMRFLEAGTIQGNHYLVMEYVGGGSVSSHLKEHGRFAVGDALYVVLACARGLHHAHEQGMIHRDVKPANILFTADGMVKLADLGLAKLTDGDDDLTRTGTGAGSPIYMAPEQALDAKYVDRRCDVYGLGCVLYTALAGKPPFQPGSVLAVLEAKQKGIYPPLRELNGDVPEAVAVVVDRMLAHHADDRYASCAEVIEAIEALGLTAPHLSFFPPQTPETPPAPVTDPEANEAPPPDPSEAIPTPPGGAAASREPTVTRSGNQILRFAVIVGGLLAVGLIVEVGLLLYLMAVGAR